MYRNNRASLRQQGYSITRYLYVRVSAAIAQRNTYISHRANKALIINYEVTPLKLHCGENLRDLITDIVPARKDPENEVFPTNR